MPLTNISAYRLAGYSFTDNDFDSNAEIEKSKLGTRTLYRTFPATSMVTDATKTSQGVFSGLLMPDASTKKIYFVFQVPKEYVSGNITAQYIWSTAATTGALRLTVTYEGRVVGESLASALSSSASDTDTAKGTTLLLNQGTFTLNSANFAANDYVSIIITRDPTDALDTIAADIIFYAISLEFTGRG